MLHWRNLAFYVVPLLLGLAVFSGVNFKSDLSAFIISGDNAEEILLASEMQSGALSRRYLIAVDGEQSHLVPAAFVQQLKSKLRAIEGVTDVWSPGENSNEIESLQTLYGGHAGSWYSLDPQRDLPQLFSEKGLVERAKLVKTVLLSPQATLIKKMLVQDPLLLALIGFKEQGAQVQKTIRENTAYSNLILETAMSGMDVPQQRQIQSAIHSAFASLNNSNDVLVEHYRLSMTGVPVFAVATQTLIQGDIKLVSLLSVVGMLLLFLFVFRSSAALFQVFSILAIVMLTAILTTHVVFGYVHGMTVAIGSTLVGICIDYPIHAIAHAQMLESEQRRLVIARIWPSMIMGGITTLVGYMALGASGYPGFQQVFIYAGSGIITSLLLTRFVLPHLLKDQPSRPLNVPFVGNWNLICQRCRPQLLGVLAILCMTSLIGFSSLHWLQDMQDLTPELDYLKQNDKRIRQRMTSIEPGRFVLVSAEDVESALYRSESVYKVLAQLKQSKALTEYYGLYPWVISKQQQQQNQTLLQSYLSSDNVRQWQQALTHEGLSVEMLGHFNYPQTTPMTVDQVLTTPVKKMLDNRIVQGSNQTLVIIWLGEHQPDAVKTALASMIGVQYFSQRELLNSMSQDVTGRARQLLFVGLIVIILLLMSRYKEPLKTLQTLLPAFLSAFIVLGLWALMGVAISFLHLIGFLLVVAICVDYGIFYQENRGGNITLTYQAMGAAMLTSAVAFACLIVSDSTALKTLSGVVVMGVFLGFLLCPIIIKTNNSPIEKNP